jgi:hypothetical protein
MLLPWYITMVLWTMFTIVCAKNFINWKHPNKTNWITIITLECAFPLIVLPLSRMSLLLRARTLNRSAELEQRLNRNNKKINVNDLEPMASMISDMDMSMSQSIKLKPVDK